MYVDPDDNTPKVYVILTISSLCRCSGIALSEEHIPEAGGGREKFRTIQELVFF